jgi:lysyl-tRNA synthetase class I
MNGAEMETFESSAEEMKDAERKVRERQLGALESLAAAVRNWAARYGVDAEFSLSSEAITAAMDYGTRKYIIPEVPKDIEGKAEALVETIGQVVLYTLRRIGEQELRRF